MNVREFAEKYGLAYNEKTNDVIGAHGVIYQFEPQSLAVLITINWTRAKEAFRKNKFTFDLTYEFRGVALFDPYNEQQAEIAIKAAVCQQAFTFK